MRGSQPDDEGERQDEAAVRHEEIVGQVVDIQEQVRPAGVWNRHLLDRVLDDRDPVGKQDNGNANRGECAKYGRASDNTGSTSRKLPKIRVTWWTEAAARVMITPFSRARHSAERDQS